jgi:tetratricopeptide (TPR) repeat protein
MQKIVSLALLLVLFASCRSKKIQSDNLTYEQKVKFNEHYFNASKQKSIGNFDEAFKEFEACYRINPKSHASMYQLANISFRNKQLDDAIYWGEKSIKTDPYYNHWYYGQLAQFYSRAGQNEKSVKIFQKMIDNEPLRPTNYIEAANQNINAQSFKEAIKILNKYQNIFGVEEESARKLEQLYIKLNKPEQALNEIAKLTIANPDEVRYWGLLAETQMTLGKKDDAQKSYTKIIGLDSLNGYAHFGLADIERAKGNNETSFKHLIMGFKDERVKLINKLQVISSYYVLMQRDEKSRLQVFSLGETLLITHPHEALSYVVYSDLLYAVNKFEESRTYLVKSLDIENSDFKVWQKLLSIDEQLNNMKTLEEDSHKAMEGFPNIPALYIYNGFALIALKQFEKSTVVSQDGLSYAIQQKDKIQLLLNLADANHQLKKYKEADKAFDAVLNLEPNNTLALNNYAYFLSLRNERLDEAENLVKRALKNEPDNPSYLDTYGWILFQKKNYSEAISQLKMALKETPKNPEILEHLGDALYKSGDTAGAQVQWKKALDSKGSDADLERKINKGSID